MKKIFIIVVAVPLLFACGKDDNYLEPSATLSGEVIDQTTGQPIITDQPNGFRIRYREISEEYPNAQNYYFWGKADGTFNNSKMFEGSYEVCPVEGAFVTPASQTVTIPGNVSFQVVPYLTITNDQVAFDSSSKTLRVSFKVDRPSGSDALPTTAFVAVSWNPSVGYYVHGVTGTGILSTKSLSADQLGDTVAFDVDVSGLPTGHKWYVRMGCGSNKNNSRFNYSSVHTFEY